MQGPGVRDRMSDTGSQGPGVRDRVSRTGYQGPSVRDWVSDERLQYHCTLLTSWEKTSFQKMQ